MMPAPDLDAMRAAMRQLADRATCINEISPGRALWGVEEGGEFVFCIAPSDADRELLADRLVDAILLITHIEAAGTRLRRTAAHRASLGTTTWQ